MVSIVLMIGGGGMFARSGVIAAMLGPLFGAFAGAAGAIVLVIGVVGLVISWLLWKMKKIGMALTIIVEILAIIFSLAGILVNPLSSVVGIIIGIVIIWYLWKKRDLFV